MFDFSLMAKSDQGGGGLTMILLLVGFFLIMWLLMIRPEKKRQKKMEEMRNNVSVGDNIVTIGGIMGKVVHVTDDNVTIESGEDRVRVQFKKTAIGVNESAKPEPQKK